MQIVVASFSEWVSRSRCKIGGRWIWKNEYEKSVIEYEKLIERGLRLSERRIYPIIGTVIEKKKKEKRKEKKKKRKKEEETRENGNVGCGREYSRTSVRVDERRGETRKGRCNSEMAAAVSKIET